MDIIIDKSECIIVAKNTNLIRIDNKNFLNELQLTTYFHTHSRHQNTKKLYYVKENEPSSKDTDGH